MILDELNSGRTFKVFYYRKINHSIELLGASLSGTAYKVLRHSYFCVMEDLLSSILNIRVK